MSRLPQFAKPGTFIRAFTGRQTFPTEARQPEQERFIRLLASDGPLNLSVKFEDISPGDKTDVTSIDDLEMDAKHIAHVYMGISIGGRVQFLHPQDTRRLQLDDNSFDQVDQQDVERLHWKDSPFHNPQFNFWIAPTDNFVPAVEVENIINGIRPHRTIDVDLLFLAQKYQFEFVETQSTIEKLERGDIPFEVADFGGKV